MVFGKNMVVLLFRCQVKYAVNMKNNIKELRVKLNLTQEELAQQVGVRRETIVFLEQGKYNPSLKLAYEVSRVLGSTINKVFIFD